MEWIGAKVNWIKKIKFFAHPYYFRIPGCGVCLVYGLKSSTSHVNFISIRKKM